MNLQKNNKHAAAAVSPRRSHRPTLLYSEHFRAILFLTTREQPLCHLTTVLDAQERQHLSCHVTGKCHSQTLQDITFPLYPPTPAAVTHKPQENFGGSDQCGSIISPCVHEIIMKLCFSS